MDPQQHLAVRLYEIHVGDIVALPDLVENGSGGGKERLLVAGGKRGEERIELVQACVCPRQTLGIAAHDCLEELHVFACLVLQPHPHLVHLVEVGEETEDGDAGKTDAEDGSYDSFLDGPHGKHLQLLNT